MALELKYKKQKSVNVQELFKFIDYFIDISEDDYISYNGEHEFEYTDTFLSFIQMLFDVDMVDDYEHLIGVITNSSINKYERCELFSHWIKEMNRVLSRPCEMKKTDKDFLKRSFFTVIKLEDIFPGSWGIDVETGTWLKLLKRTKELYESGEL